MKSKKIILLLLCLALAVAAACTVVACDKDDTPPGTETPVTYTVTVEGGTLAGGQTSGTFESGTSVTVTATVPSGKEFVRWTVGGTEVSTQNPYTFEVTENVTVVAVFEDEAVAPVTYTVTVEGGTLAGGQTSGTFESGTSVTVTATVPSGKEFVRWTVGGTEVSTQNPYTFEVTENVTVVAVFEDEEPVTPASYAVSVTDGVIVGSMATSATVDANASLTIIPNAIRGKKFVGWNLNGTPIDGAGARYTATITANSEFTATYEDLATYTVTIVNGTLADGSTASVAVEEGSSITVIPKLTDYQRFVKWTSDGQDVSSENPYTFAPTKTMTLTAVIEAKPAVSEGDAISLTTSKGNPIGGFGFGDSTFDEDWDTTTGTPWQEGERDYPVYAGDPSIMVVDDPVTGKQTAYLYVGHDVTADKVTTAYTMPEWLCYSSTDLVHWKAESIIMDMHDIPWANNDDSAWAAQVIEYRGYYWFFFCTWSNIAGENGNHCIGLAISDSPTGPFECYDTPLVYSSWTNRTDNGVNMNDAGWNDIDPTGWVTEDGEFYIAWGNSNSFMCQVEMVPSTDNGTSYDVELEIVDQSESTNGNIVTTDEPTFYSFGYNNIENVADIMRIDLYTQNPNGNTFTEAPYIYARDLDGDGSVDRYYMLYAAGFREALAYSYIDVTSPDGLWEDVWNYGNLLMEPTATSNTNHPAIFDFNGKTYIVYHNGSLEYGFGYRRVACIAEVTFTEDGFLEFIPETATGLRGVRSIISSGDLSIAHVNFLNPQVDTDSTYVYPLEIETGLWDYLDLDDVNDRYWMFTEGKYVPDGATASNYVSIQSENKPGLYITYDIATGKVVITQDSEPIGSAEALADKMNMTFKTLAGKNGEGVMFQCAADSSYYLANVNGELVVTNSATVEQRTFGVVTESANGTETFRTNDGCHVIIAE